MTLKEEKTEINTTDRMKYLFIGEERSKTAIERNMRWEDEALCAKTLFRALRAADIAPEECSFMNLFEPLRPQGIMAESHTHWINALRLNGYHPIAMGRRVERGLNKLGVKDFGFIFHPATRGSIRARDNYINHVKEQLT